jgi:hypothetical protein
VFSWSKTIVSFHFFWNANDNTFFLIINTAHWVHSGLKYIITVVFCHYNLSESVSENSNTLVCNRPSPPQTVLTTAVHPRSPQHPLMCGTSVCPLFITTVIPPTHCQPMTDPKWLSVQFFLIWFLQFPISYAILNNACHIFQVSIGHSRYHQSGVKF